MIGSEELKVRILVLAISRVDEYEFHNICLTILVSMVDEYDVYNIFLAILV